MAINGAVLGLVSEQKMRHLSQQAGFGSLRRLPLDDPDIALYQLKA